MWRSMQRVHSLWGLSPSHLLFISRKPSRESRMREKLSGGRRQAFHWAPSASSDPTPNKGRQPPAQIVEGRAWSGQQGCESRR
jgi:hypothetical protein